MRSKRKKNHEKKVNYVTKKRINHSKQRAKDRYHVKLTDEDIARIANIIKRGESVFLFRSSLSKTLHEIEYKGIKFYAIYSSKCRTILTVLSKEQAKATPKLMLCRKTKQE